VPAGLRTGHFMYNASSVSAEVIAAPPVTQLHCCRCVVCLEVIINCNRCLSCPTGASAGAGGQGLIPGAPAWLSLGGSVGAGTERRSRRARKGRQPINMSSSGTLRELKLNVFQVLGVHPGNVQVGRGPCTNAGDVSCCHAAAGNMPCSSLHALHSLRA
jgi:hypothetical protein